MCYIYCKLVKFIWQTQKPISIQFETFETHFNSNRAYAIFAIDTYISLSCLYCISSLLSTN